jgi:predicted phage terminase large subunit-like protein
VKTESALAIAARDELARRRLSDYGLLMDPAYVPAAHTKLLCDRLEALERRDIQRLAISLPPRHGKSHHASVLFPSWYLGRNPGHQLVLASYGAELAERHSRRTRDLLRSDRYPFETRVSDTSNAQNRWETTSGGFVLATGVGGGLTGHGAHVLIIDDPIAGPEDADSATARDRLWEWFSVVARTRLMPDGVICIASTRWSHDDLTGRILASADAPNWDVLSLPAIAEENDPLEREIGAALWPAWFPVEKLPSVQRGEISSRQFESLYQQHPSPAEGNTFRRDWLEHRYPALPTNLHIIMAVDSAWKTGVSNDWSVIQTWGTDGSRFYLIDVWRERVEYPRLREIVQNLAARFRPRQILVEEAASGLAIVADLQSTALPVLGVHPHGSKVMRAEAVTPSFESGRVLLPAVAPWLEAYVSELAVFPAGKHDDQVDATSLALSGLQDYLYRTREDQSRQRLMSKAASQWRRHWRNL